MFIENTDVRQATLDKILYLVESDKRLDVFIWYDLVKAFIDLDVADLEFVEETKKLLIQKGYDLNNEDIPIKGLSKLKKGMSLLTEVKPDTPYLEYIRIFNREGTITSEILPPDNINPYEINALSKFLIRVSGGLSPEHGNDITYYFKSLNIDVEPTPYKPTQQETEALKKSSINSLENLYIAKSIKIQGQYATGTIRVRSVVNTNKVAGDWSLPLTFKIIPGRYIGFVEDIEASSSMRIGTGTVEDTKFNTKTVARMNDNSNEDDITTLFNGFDFPQGFMKRVIMRKDGTIRGEFPRYAEYNSDVIDPVNEQVMVEIPEFHYVDGVLSVKGTSTTKKYYVKLVSMQPFEFDISNSMIPLPEKYLENISWEGNGTLSGDKISSIVQYSFYVGAFGSSQGSNGSLGSFFGDWIADMSPSIDTHRERTKQFGTNPKDWDLMNYYEYRALALLFDTERGYVGNYTASEGSNKWGPSIGDPANYTTPKMCLTASLGNETGIIKNSSNKVLSCSYRGVEGLIGFHRGVLLGGAHMKDRKVYVAPRGAEYKLGITGGHYKMLREITEEYTSSGAYGKYLLPGELVPYGTGGSTSSYLTCRTYMIREADPYPIIMGGCVTNAVEGSIHTMICDKTWPPTVPSRVTFRRQSDNPQVTQTATEIAITPSDIATINMGEKKELKVKTNTIDNEFTVASTNETKLRVKTKSQDTIELNGITEGDVNIEITATAKGAAPYTLVVPIKVLPVEPTQLEVSPSPLTVDTTQLNVVQTLTVTSEVNDWSYTLSHPDTNLIAVTRKDDKTLQVTPKAKGRVTINIKGKAINKLETQIAVVCEITDPPPTPPEEPSA